MLNNYTITVRAVNSIGSGNASIGVTNETGISLNIYIYTVEPL